MFAYGFIAGVASVLILSALVMWALVTVAAGEDFEGE